MADDLPDLDVRMVPRTGHAPSFDEPGVTDAIGRWLVKVDPTYVASHPDDV